MMPAVIVLFINQTPNTDYPPSMPKYQIKSKNGHHLVQQMQNYPWHWQFTSQQPLYMPPEQPLLPELDIQLHTIVVLKSGDGGVVLSIQQGEPQVLRLGEASDEGVVLKAIEENRVLIEEFGKRRWIALPSSTHCSYLSDTQDNTSDIAKKLFFKEC